MTAESADYTREHSLTKPGRRLRAGCIAHARRKLFEQRQRGPSEFSVTNALACEIRNERLKDEPIEVRRVSELHPRRGPLFERVQHVIGGRRAG